MIYISADGYQMWNGKQSGPILVLKLLMDVEWEAVMASIGPEFFNVCEMGSSNSIY
jgi:hypothetical protein